MSAFEKYFKSLQGHALDEITEHSHRNSLQQLLEAFAPSKIKILHEPKREGKFGSPDFKITSTESIVGYVENKKIEENLDKTLKTEQLKKYQALSDNILLTNYIEWVWIREGKVNKREVLCFKSDIENKKKAKKYLSKDIVDEKPDVLFKYVYSILFSPTYRTKYLEFLRINFPRIPFTPDKKIFEQLSVLGSELIQAHLMEGDVPDYPYGVYLGKGNNIVEKPRFVPEKGKGKLFINQTQYFDDVPADVYNFYIGGYPVLDKYLKDRKGRDILHESEHIERIIKTLAFTIDQMKKIDELTKSWI